MNLNIKDYVQNDTVVFATGEDSLYQLIVTENKLLTSAGDTVYIVPLKQIADLYVEKLKGSAASFTIKSTSGSTVNFQIHEATAVQKLISELSARIG